MKRHVLVTIGLVIIAVIGSIVAIIRLQKNERHPLEQARIEQEKIQNALNNLLTVQHYQQYCTKSIQRIEESENLLKIVPVSAKASPDYYAGGEKVTCTARSTSSDCQKIPVLNFTSVYECPSEPISVAVSDTNGIRIRNQYAGTAVVVDLVILEKPGFVAISAPTENDRTIIAASPFLAEGISEIVSIAIPKALTLGRSYSAHLYIDNGDGVFEIGSDIPVEQDGVVLSAPFTADKRLTGSR